MFDVVALGECLIDFTPCGISNTGVPLYSQNPGGAPANVLAMLSKLGYSTAFIGKVGKDAFGSFLKGKLEAAGICCNGLVQDAEYLTSLAFVTLDSSGDRSFLFYRDHGADLMIEDDDVDKKLIDDARVFHFGSVSMNDEPGRTTTIRTAEYARKKGLVISYDPNYRPFIWDCPETAKRVIGSVLSLCDIVKVSEEEMVLLTDETDLEKGSSAIAAEGPSIVIVTLGPKGAFVRHGGFTEQFRTFDVKTIDTTGAGDAFYGAFLSKMLTSPHFRNNEIGLISNSWITESMVYANAAGSLTTTAYGAIPAMPLTAEIDECMKNAGLLGGSK